MGRVKGRALGVLLVLATFLGAVAEFLAKVTEGREDLFSLVLGKVSAHHGAKGMMAVQSVEKGIYYHNFSLGGL